MKISVKIKTAVVVICLFALVSSAQTILYSENFTLPDGTTQGTGTPPNWTLSGNPIFWDHFEVRSNQMEANKISIEGAWISKTFDITGFTDVTLSADLSSAGSLSSGDYIRGFYKLDGGSELQWFNITGSTAPVTRTFNGISGGSLQVVIRMRNDNGETWFFDNVTVTGNCATNAGTASVSQTVISSGQTVDLALTGHNGSIQWQQSTDNISFTDIAAGVSRSTDGGSTWQDMSNGLAVTQVLRMANSWEELPSPRTNAWYADIDFNLEDPDVLIISCSSSADFTPQPLGTDMIFRVDYAAPSQMQPDNCPPGVCTDLTMGLPNTFLGKDALVFEKGSDGGMYLATDFGVFFTNNKKLTAGSGWEMIGTELPHVTVNGLEINYEINRIRAGVFGRGVWEHDLFCPPDFDVNETATYAQDVFVEAEHDINSTAIVNTGINATYRAGNEIRLEPGFEAREGSEFHAFIHACNAPGNSFRAIVIPWEEDMDAVVLADNKNEYELFRLYPNPGRDIIRMEPALKPNEIVPYRIDVYDVTGKRVFSTEFVGEHEQVLDFSGHPDGIYFIRVIDPLGVAAANTLKVIINRNR